MEMPLTKSIWTWLRDFALLGSRCIPSHGQYITSDVSAKPVPQSVTVYPQKAELSRQNCHKIFAFETRIRCGLAVSTTIFWMTAHKNLFIYVLHAIRSCVPLLPQRMAWCWQLANLVSNDKRNQQHLNRLYTPLSCGALGLPAFSSR